MKPSRKIGGNNIYKTRFKLGYNACGMDVYRISKKIKTWKIPKIYK